MYLPESKVLEGKSENIGEKLTGENLRGFFLSCRPVPIVAELEGKIPEFEPAVCKLDGRVRKLTLLR